MDQACLGKARLGHCRFADTCKYAASHSWSEDVLRQRSLCRYYVKSGGKSCTYGDRCLFIHELPPRKLCVQYSRLGKCRWGDECRFIHTPPSPPPEQNKTKRAEDAFAGTGSSNKPNPKAHAPPPRRTPPKPTRPPTSPKNKRSGHRDPPPPHNPDAKAEALVSHGVQAYKQAVYTQAIQHFDSALKLATRISLLVSIQNNRAHAYWKLANTQSKEENHEKALEACKQVTVLSPTGHYKTLLLSARIQLFKKSFTEAISLCKLAHRAGSSVQRTEAFELLELIMAERIFHQRKLQEQERAEQEERKKKEEHERRVRDQMNEFEYMSDYQILGVSRGATSTEIKKAYRIAALKYHPDKPGGDNALFQRISEAFETLRSGH